MKLKIVKRSYTAEYREAAVRQVKYHRQSRWLEMVSASKAPMKP